MQSSPGQAKTLLNHIKNSKTVFYEVALQQGPMQ